MFSQGLHTAEEFEQAFLYAYCVTLGRAGFLQPPTSSTPRVKKKTRKQTNKQTKNPKKQVGLCVCVIPTNTKPTKKNLTPHKK